MNNVFVTELAKSSVPAKSDISPEKFVVEDNVGEAIHVHLRNLRLEMSVRDYLSFAEACERALVEAGHGNR